MLAAQAPMPVRDGVILETPFVGPGMRDAGERLDYLPMRLSLVPTAVRDDAPAGRRAAAHLDPATGRSRSGSRSTSS